MDLHLEEFHCLKVCDLCGVNIEAFKLPEHKVQCFKSRDDNFLSKWPIFQTHFSEFLVNFGVLNSYGGQ